MISAQVKAKQSRQGQEGTGQFSRQRWQRAQWWWEKCSQALTVSSVLWTALYPHGATSTALTPLQRPKGNTLEEWHLRDLLCLFFIEVCSSWIVVSVTLAKAVAVEQYPWWTKYDETILEKRKYKEIMRHQWNRVITLEKKEINTIEVAISVRNSACLGHNQGSTSGSKLCIYKTGTQSSANKMEALNSLYRLEKKLKY